AQQFALTKVEMAELIAQHTGQTFEQVTEDSDRDRWFTAQQALEYGMVDHVVSRAAQAGGVGA
ncbi:MAG: ATP-dependent Clp protease proteolytic subunit, partial [Rhodococcus fascians]